MKFIKTTLHRSLRDINGADAFAQHNVYWVSLRCTTHNEYTIMVFGEDENVDKFLAEYGRPTIMSLHHNKGAMKATEVAEVLGRRGVRVHPLGRVLEYAEEGEQKQRRTKLCTLTKQS